MYYDKSESKPILYRNIVDIDLDSMYPNVVSSGTRIISRSKDMSRKDRRHLRRAAQRFGTRITHIVINYVDDHITYSCNGRIVQRESRNTPNRFKLDFSIIKYPFIKKKDGEE